MSSSCNHTVVVQAQDFNAGLLQVNLLRGSHFEGAVVTFTGYVRNESAARVVNSMSIEHYAGMTESSIAAIQEEASDRWPLIASHVTHRIGTLAAGSQIVWVGATSAHRGAAFSACEFIMDYLKNRAPFWKKECGPAGDSWVSAKEQDTQRAQRWE